MVSELPPMRFHVRSPRPPSGLDDLLSIQSYSAMIYYCSDTRQNQQKERHVGEVQGNQGQASRVPSKESHIGFAKFPPSPPATHTGEMVPISEAFYWELVT